jgi:hypothetical protein
MSTTTPQFDLDRFTGAAEARDAATQLSMYGPGATVTIMDEIARPSTPRVLRTESQIKTWLEDLCGRDMTHSVTHRVIDGSSAAYTLACRYPDGTQALCATLIELQDDHIKDQIVVQVWDEK